MNNFTTRVELRDARDDRDYEALHRAMEAAGFSRTIRGLRGMTYHLPAAEYHYRGDRTLEQVKALAKKAAVRTRRDYSILVTQSGGRAWVNLDPAEDEEDCDV